MKKEWENLNRSIVESVLEETKKKKVRSKQQIRQDILIAQQESQGIFAEEHYHMLKYRAEYPNFYKKGFLQLCIERAEITRDTDSYFSKMDPYIVFCVNGQEFKTETADEAGKEPVWNQNFEFHVENMKDEIVFKVFDKDIWPLPDDAVGWAAVKMSSLCINGGRSFSVDLFFNNDYVGILKLATIFTPGQQMSINFDTQYIERLINELNGTTELLKADAETNADEATKNAEKLLKDQTRINFEKAETQTQKDKLQSYKKLYNKFFKDKYVNDEEADEKRKKMKNSDLVQLDLGTYSTVIEASDYQREVDDFVAQHYFPSKLLEKAFSKNDKWVCNFTSGWISLTFEKPIIFRGYGFITADVPGTSDHDDEIKKNPSAWTVSVKEAIMKKSDMKTDDTEDKYYVMDKRTDVKPPLENKNIGGEKTQTHIFRIGKARQRMIRAIKVDFERNRGHEEKLQLARFFVYS